MNQPAEAEQLSWEGSTQKIPSVTAKSFLVMWLESIIHTHKDILNDFESTFIYADCSSMKLQCEAVHSALYHKHSSQ